jgi:hypothetical protein
MAKGFPMTNLFLTARVSEVMKQDNGFQEFVTASIERHFAGDWGEVSVNSKRENDIALSDGSRLLSAYSKNERRIWIITEADRSATTVLFPEEY